MKQVAMTTWAGPGLPVVGFAGLVDIQLIEEDPNNARRTFDQDKLEQLAATLKLEGQLYACRVRLHGQKLRLEDGARRYRALKLLGAKHIKVEVEDGDDKKASVRAAIANLQREDLTPYEQARALRQLLDGGLNKKEAAQAAGIVYNTLQGRLDLLALPEPLAELAGQGAFSVAHAQLLTPLVGKATTTPKGPVSLVEAAAEHVKTLIAKNKVLDLWRFPNQIAEPLSEANLVRCWNYNTVGDLDYSAQEGLVLKGVPSVTLGDGKRSHVRRLYLDVADFDRRVQEAQTRRLEKLRVENAKAREARGKVPEPAWKKEARRNDLASQEARRLMRAAVVSTLQSGTPAISAGLWGAVLVHVEDHDEFTNEREDDQDDGTLSCVKVAAAAAQFSIDDVHKTFSLKVESEKSKLQSSSIYGLRKLGVAPTWWTKAPRDRQAIFLSALLAAGHVNTRMDAVACELLTGHKPKEFEAKGLKAAEKVLAAEKLAKKAKIPAKPRAKPAAKAVPAKKQGAKPVPAKKPAPKPKKASKGR